MMHAEKRKILKKSKLKSKEMAVLEAGLFVALANGRMFHVNLKNGQIEPVRLTSLEVSPAHVPSLNVLLLLDSNGKLVKPPAGEWHDLTHDDAAYGFLLAGSKRNSNCEAEMMSTRRKSRLPRRQ